MSNNPLSIIDLMEREYDVSIEGDDSAGKVSIIIWSEG